MNQIDKNTVSSENQLPENEFITFDSPMGTDGLRVLFIGNSITRHGVKKDIGWYGDWGMAASSKDKDYVHLVLSKIRESHPDASACICQCAEWERFYTQGVSCLEKFKAARDFAADIIIIRVIENCDHKEFDREVFLREYKNMIEYFNSTGKARVVVTTSFWIHPLDEQIRTAAQQCGYEIAELGVLGEGKKNMAIGLFEHEGVAMHPGDEGMKAIADAIFAKIRSRGFFTDTIKMDKKQTKMVAHRGVSALEPENTVAAFVAAANRSYDGIETDVHVTADGKFVLCHDDNTVRTSGVDKIIEKSTYDELKKIKLLDLHSKTPENSRSDLYLPDLKDYIRICKKYGKTVVLEIKSSLTDESAKNMIAEIEEENYLGSVIFISFNWDNLVLMRSLLPNQPLQFLCGWSDELIEKLKSQNMDIDIWYSDLTKERIDLFHKNGITINCWTVDDKETGKALACDGVDFITSNILE